MESLSIITAVRNNTRFIGDALASSVAQECENKEIVVVDGGSTDGTVDVVRSFGSAISTFVSKPDRGLYDALNKGIALARGDVLAFLHSDDVFDAPDVASALLRAFEDPDVDAAYGNLLYVDRESGETVRTWKSRPFSRLDLWTGWMPPHPAFFMRRSRYVEWGGFTSSFQISGDYDALLRYLLLNHARAAYVNKTIVRMRTGGVSNRSLGSLMTKSREDLLAMHRNGVLGFPTIALKPLRKVRQYWA